MAEKLKTYDGTARTPAVDVQRIVSLLVEGPMLWLARRNGICKGFPHRIEFREDFYRINGKPYCPRCAQKVIEAEQANAALSGVERKP